jgi:hypothetical protein
VIGTIGRLLRREKVDGGGKDVKRLATARSTSLEMNERLDIGR